MTGRDPEQPINVEIGNVFDLHPFAPGDVSAVVRSWGRADTRLRIDVDLKVIRVDRAFDGTSGWERRGGSVAPLADSDLAPLARSALLNPLLSYKRTAVPMTLEDRERIGDREAWVLEFTPVSGSPERFYIDTETFSVLRETRISPRPAGDVELVISYADYRPVSGVMLPFSIITERGGQMQTVTLAGYKINQSQSEALYDNPQQIASMAGPVLMRSRPAGSVRQCVSRSLLRGRPRGSDAYPQARHSADGQAAAGHHSL